MPAPKINMDRSFFTVISQLPSGTIVQPEMELGWDRETVTSMAIEGQFDTVLAIFENNPVEGTSINITADVFPAAEADEGDDPADYTSERIDASLAGVTSRRAA